MNQSQKIVLFFSSLLLLIGTLFFLVFSLFVSSSVFLGYSSLIIFLTIIFIYFTSSKELSDDGVATKFKNSNQILYSAHSVFPFQIFPDRYFIQQKTISIVRKHFFSQGWVETISIKDIGGIRLYTGPFFSSITIIRKVLPQTTVELRNLWKKDAFKLKELLDGLVITENKLVEMPNQIPLKTEKKILFEIGTEKEVEKEI